VVLWQFRDNQPLPVEAENPRIEAAAGWQAMSYPETPEAAALALMREIMRRDPHDAKRSNLPRRTYPLQLYAVPDRRKWTVPQRRGAPRPLSALTLRRTLQPRRVRSAGLFFFVDATIAALACSGR
jgi:hypothetical protein